MSSVLILHPGRQHSHQLAWAIFDQKLLLTYWSGVPVVSTSDLAYRYLPRALARRLREVPIPAEFRRSAILFPILLRIGQRLPEWLVGDDISHRLCHLFDWWASKYIQSLNPKAVVGYENSCWRTFIEAKKYGAICVLDAASFHHSVGRRLGVDRQTSYSKKVDHQKEQEVDLADIIITCSPVAAESYIAAGVPPGKVRTLLLGTDIPEIASGEARHSAVRKFIFAGVLSSRKAIDVILSVFRRLDANNFSVEVVFVGAVDDPGWLEAIQATPNAKYHPSVPPTTLYSFFADSDCLLLPSRFDSFGMVVPEAMACGTPAIVSAQTGAKAIVEEFPGAGWIVDCDTESLYACVEDLVRNPKKLKEARVHAKQAAQHFSWKAYRERAGQLFTQILKP